MNITRGVIKKAQKVIVYGPEGIGKSTFASKFPDPLFIDTEGSTTQMDIARLDKPTSWTMLKALISEIIKEQPCKTLVIDTADWAERMCIEFVCSSHGKAGIEDFGYGNGYTYVAEEWGRFLNLLQDVIDVANINVVLTAHAIIRKFEQPNEMGAYDRYELKLGKRTTAQTAPITKEWADMVLFANYKTFSIAVDDKGKKHKAQGGKRVMYTTHHPCWDAKNRHDLPDELPFEYDAISHILIGMDSYKAQTNELHLNDYAEPQIHTVVQEKDDWEGIPKALSDLMHKDNVTPHQVQKAVSVKGYFPADMPIKDYDPNFIQGVLIGAWNKVLEEIKMPF